MADFRRGIKGGVAAAGVYLVIAVILAAIGRTFWYPGNFIHAAGLGIQLELSDPSLVILSILSRIVRGIVFGAFFAALYDYLPGATAVKKGVVLSVFVWILGAVGLIYMTPGWPAGASHTSTAGITVSLSSIGLALVSIIFALAFGALVGAIWNKLREKEVTEVRKGMAALLVGFILGAWMWVSPAVGIIRYVVTEGTLAMEPGPLWWVNILSTLVAFIGPFGWVLALAAWRKTKRGKSGFKWGVAGGVIMALTGLMLLPGALAITGGVLSGRKPASESDTAEIEQ